MKLSAPILCICEKHPKLVYGLLVFVVGFATFPLGSLANRFLFSAFKTSPDVAGGYGLLVAMAVTTAFLRLIEKPPLNGIFSTYLWFAGLFFSFYLFKAK